MIITTLPNEILAVICSLLDVRSLKALRLTHRYLASVPAQKLFQTLRVDGYTWQSYFVSKRFQSGMLFLKHLEGAPLARSITVLTINPGLTVPPTKDSLWTKAQARFFASSINQDVEWRRKATKELKDTLIAVIPCLNGIQSVKFIAGTVLDDYRGEVDLFQSLMSSLVGLPRLVHLSVSSFSPFPPSLCRLSDLRSLKIHHPLIDGDRAILVKIISGSPQLILLDLCRVWMKDLSNDGELELHTLLRRSEATPPIESLTLSGGISLQHPELLPRFHQLKSLKISAGVNVPRSFWLVLKQEDVQLNNINIESISPGFVTYITSYSGLESLSIIGVPTQQNDTLFPALSNHAGTLAELRVGGDVWCLNFQTVTMIQTWHNLMDIDIPMTNVHGHLAVDRMTTRKISQQVLGALSCWPRLQRITFLVREGSTRLLDDLRTEVQCYHYQGNLEARSLTVQVGAHGQFGYVAVLKENSADTYHFQGTVGYLSN